MTSAGSENPRRRRRQSSARQSRTSGAWLRSVYLDRSLRIGMIVVSAFYVLYTIYAVRQASFMTGALIVGMSQQETRYLIGPPLRVDPGTGNWFYNPAGSTLKLAFYGSGRALSIVCTDERLETFGCTDVLGIGIGAVEDDLWYALGAPTEQRYAGDDKIMTYADLGISFVLRKYRVVSIEHGVRSGRLDFLPRAFRVMVPH